MKKIIHLLNGRTVEALLLETVADTKGNSWDIYYAQGDIIECQHAQEIRSWNIISTLVSQPMNKPK